MFTSGPSAAPPRRSVPGGRADEIGVKADFGARMSAVRGKADVVATWPQSPFLTPGFWCPYLLGPLARPRRLARTPPSFPAVKWSSLPRGCPDLHAPRQETAEVRAFQHIGHAPCKAVAGSRVAPGAPRPPVSGVSNGPQPPRGSPHGPPRRGLPSWATDPTRLRPPRRHTPALWRPWRPIPPGRPPAAHEALAPGDPGAPARPHTALCRAALIGGRPPPRSPAPRPPCALFGCRPLVDASRARASGG